MEKLAKKLENKAIRNWGFESKKTIAIFRLTALLRKAAIPGGDPAADLQKKIYKKGLTKRKDYGIMNMEGRKEGIK